MAVKLGGVILGIVEAGCVKMDFAWPIGAFKAHLRAAIAAETAGGDGRGLIEFALADPGDA